MNHKQVITPLSRPLIRNVTDKFPVANKIDEPTGAMGWKERADSVKYSPPVD